MSIELLQKISDRFNVAVTFHNEQSQLFTILSLQGFSELHNYQHLDELLTLKRLKTYIIRTFGEAPPDFIPEDAGILKPLLNGRNRQQIKHSERIEIVKQAWKSYSEWETETLSEYSAIAKKLHDSGEIASYEYVSTIVRDVSEELKRVNDTITAMENHNWDMSQITADQGTLTEAYIYKMRKLFKKFKAYHHYNSLT